MKIYLKENAIKSYIVIIRTMLGIVRDTELALFLPFIFSPCSTLLKSNGMVMSLFFNIWFPPWSTFVSKELNIDLQTSVKVCEGTA